MDKHIKINKPIPEMIKNAIKAKQEWREKVQSGEIKILPSQNVKVIG